MGFFSENDFDTKTPPAPKRRKIQDKSFENNLFIKLSFVSLIIYLPEDTVNSTPNVSHFLFFYGPPARDTMCNMVIFV